MWRFNRLRRLDYAEKAEWCEDTSKDVMYEIKTGKSNVESLKATIAKEASNIDPQTAKIGTRLRRITAPEDSTIVDPDSTTAEPEDEKTTATTTVAPSTTSAPAEPCGPEVDVAWALPPLVFTTLTRAMMPFKRRRRSKKNGDGSLTFTSDGYPDLKLEKSAREEAEALSGHYQGSVPFINVESTVNGDNTADAVDKVTSDSDSESQSDEFWPWSSGSDSDHPCRAYSCEDEYVSAMRSLAKARKRRAALLG